MALAGEVVAAAFAVATPLPPTPEVIAFEGAPRAAEEGVKATAVVVAFEPADDDPDAANDDEAPGPLPPAEVLVWIYKS
jgi:hypothetical protein